MIRAMWRAYRVKVLIEKEIGDWEVRIYDDERIKNDMKWEAEQKIREAINERIQYQLDDEVIRRLAQEFLDNFDFKTAVNDAMKEKVKEFIRSGVSR